MKINFDAWRHNYDGMSYPEHVEFYRQAAEAYPEQVHFNEAAVRSFLESVAGNVLEIGGWKGELAAAVLPDHPAITVWLNVEIAPQAVSESVCTDSRYSVVVPDTFLWDSDIDLSPYPTMIASHVIEHMKVAHVVKLLDHIPAVAKLYIDAPLAAEPQAWGGGESAHIIEIGWQGLMDMLAGYGFHGVGGAQGRWGPAYWFDRATT